MGSNSGDNSAVVRLLAELSVRFLLQTYMTYPLTMLTRKFCRLGNI